MATPLMDTCLKSFLISLALTIVGPIRSASAQPATVVLSGVTLMGIEGVGESGDASSSATPLTSSDPAPAPEGGSPARDARRFEEEWTRTLENARRTNSEDVAEKLRILIGGLHSSQVLWRHLPPGSPPGGPDFQGHPYDLDGARSPREIVAQGVGGSCGSYGKVLAHALVETGTDPDRVWLIDTVGENQRGPATRARSPEEAPGSGHQFLLVNDRRNGWILADSTSRTLDSVRFHSPREIRTRMESPDYPRDPLRIRPAEGGASGTPSFPNLLPRTERGPDGQPIEVGPPQDIFKDLVIFRVVRSLDYPDHRIADRIREIVRVVPAVGPVP